MRSSTIRLLLALALVAGLACACGVPIESSARRIAPADLPEGLRTGGSIAPRPAQPEEAVRVWFVREDHLAGTLRTVGSPPDPQVVLDELLSGPSDAEQQQSLRSAIADPAAVIGVSIAGGVATVALSAAFSDIPANDQILAVGELVLTLTDLRGIGRVAFQVEGTDVAVPLPTGNASATSVSRDDYLQLAGDGDPG
jgi:spore germination protein GerM